MHNPNYMWFIRCHKSIFWLRSSWLTGVSQPWPWLRTPVSPGEQFITLLTIVTVKNTELLSRESWIRLLHRGDSLDMFETEFKLWQDLCSPKQWPLGMLVENQDSKFLRSTWMLLTSVFFSVWDTSGAELSRPGPILGPFWEHKTLNLNHQWRPLAFFQASLLETGSAQIIFVCGVEMTKPGSL